MASIFVNGCSAKSGGGKSVLENFLKAACESESQHSFSVVVPDVRLFQHIECDRITFISLGWFSKTMMLPLTNAFLLPLLIRRGRYDAVLNFADLPIPTKTLQSFLFDWSYAAYPESPAWKLSSSYEYVHRKLKLWIFKRYLRYVDDMIAQSAHMRQLLLALYNVENVHVVPNATSVDNFVGDELVDFGLSDGFKLLCLSRYYSHKNIEVLVNVARSIKEQNLGLKMVITIDADQGPGAAQILQQIESENLQDVLINVGPVPMENVPDLYRQTDALILPTLLESFSGTYVEAMFHEKPIFTSNLDFATSICGDAAFYFDPHDADDILATILRGVNEPEVIRNKVGTAKQLLAEMPDWTQNFHSFIAIIEKAMRETK